MRIWQEILNFLLPPRCLECGCQISNNTGLCDECIEKITFISGNYCQKCGEPLNGDITPDDKLLCGRCIKKKRFFFRLIRSACVYDNASKNLILGFKFMDKTENAKFLAQMMYVAGSDIFDKNIDVIVPVPLHYTRLIERRYNQSALMARELGKLCDAKVDCLSLIKVKKTKPQVEMSGIARLRNVQGAFRVKDISKLRGKRVLLIDDVMTTGSTLKACAVALKKAGVKSVDCLTVARVC